jgi:hypothetical protein
MADYGEILEFLAANPPQFAGERELHASLLEMIAKCLRSDTMAEEEISLSDLQTRHIRWVDFN